jgi:hypothetical protein
VWRPVHHIAMLVATAVVVLPWVSVGRTLGNAKPVTPKFQASSVVWGDRVFSSDESLRRWMRARGASFAGWGHRHPQAHKTLQRQR